MINFLINIFFFCEKIVLKKMKNNNIFFSQGAAAPAAVLGSAAAIVLETPCLKYFCLRGNLKMAFPHRGHFNCAAALGRCASAALQLNRSHAPWLQACMFYASISLNRCLCVCMSLSFFMYLSLFVSVSSWQRCSLPTFPAEPCR